MCTRGSITNDSELVNGSNASKKFTQLLLVKRARDLPQLATRHTSARGTEHMPHMEADSNRHSATSDCSDGSGAVATNSGA